MSFLRTMSLLVIILSPAIRAADSPAKAVAAQIILNDWRVEISPETLAFTAKLASGVEYKISDKVSGILRVEAFSRSERRISWSLPEKQLSVSVEADGNRLRVRFTSKIEQAWTWPTLKANTDITHFIVPDGEGLILPVGDNFWWQEIADGVCQTFHSGLSMPFFGTISPSSQFVYIVSTDLGSELCLGRAGERLNAASRYEFQPQNGLSTYEVIIAPVEKTPIGAALEYRSWLEEKKEFVSLKDKISRNPEVEKIIGATHTYLWGDGRSRESIKKIHDAGIDRLWLGYDQDPRSDKYLVDKEAIEAARQFGYLIGPYDTFDNIQPPKSADAVSSVFDDELYKTGCVIRKDGKKMKGFAGRGCQLSSEALRVYQRPFVKERVAKFDKDGVNSYFLDCDAFGDFLDDHDKQHPMNRSKDRENRAERMKFIADESKMVLGSEGGTAWSTKFVTFLHGAHDTYNHVFWPLLKDKKAFGTWWPPEEMGVFFKKVKVSDRFMQAKYAPRYRLPLFQTVFHDSVVSTERWELSLPKIPAAAQVRALFWQLYNVAPIWNLNQKEWRQFKDRAVEHHRFFSEVHRTTAFLPLTDFEWLDEAKLVQRVRFGNSLALTANFSARDFESLQPLCIVAAWSKDAKRLTYCPKSFSE